MKIVQLFYILWKPDNYRFYQFLWHLIFIELGKLYFQVDNAPNASEPDVMINILGTKNTEKKGKSAQNW